MKKIYLFISFILVLFIACAAKEIKEEVNMESKVDKKLDVSKITYDKNNRCYYFKYKYVLSDYEIILPIYNGLNGAIDGGNLYNYCRSFEDKRPVSPTLALCLPVQKGGYSTIMAVLQFYQKEGFIKDIGEMDVIMGNMWPQAEKNLAAGIISLESKFDNKIFILTFNLTVTNFHKYKKYPIFTTPIYKKKLKDITELIKDFEKLPYKNNMLSFSININQEKE